MKWDKDQPGWCPKHGNVPIEGGSMDAIAKMAESADTPRLFAFRLSCGCEWRWVSNEYGL